MVIDRGWYRVALVVGVLGLGASACTESDDEGATETTTAGSGAATDGTGADGGETGAAEPIDYVGLGLWDDGPCDDSLEPLVVGLTTAFETAIITAVDAAVALEASAVGFNERGGANGHCIEVVTCDDGADPNRAIECARSADESGVVVTINDSSNGPGPEVGDVYREAGIARFAVASGTPDLTDLNTYPFDAGGIGTTIVMPQGLVDEGVTKIAVIRVDIAAFSALFPIYEGIYADRGIEFVADIPVVAGTTDYSQYILAAEAAGAEGVMLAVGGQEGIQVLRAGQQLDTDLLISASLGTLPYADMVSLGDFADQIILNSSSPPATADVPVLAAVLDDLAASGADFLQPETLKATPMHSWIGLYALLSIIRTAGTEDFSRTNITSLIEASGEIDMLGLTAPWTPNVANPGAFPRTGNGFYAFWRWDPAADFDGNGEGNFVAAGEVDFQELLCGSALGAPAESC
jgi:branched-chain amino acid transport system substrate-binding protein